MRIFDFSSYRDSKGSIGLGSRLSGILRNGFGWQAEIQMQDRIVDRFAKVLGDLNLSALEAGHLPIQALPLEVEPFLRSLVSSLVPAGPRGSKENRLELRVDADLPEIIVDEQMLTSALSHLIDNAFKYAPSGPILLRAVREGQRVEISVCDRGPGLSPEQIKLLFQMFSRLENPDAPRVRGYGLGLYMSKRFVEAMGGEIAAASSPGQGLTVTIRLPTLKEEP
jgi:signal transduction histidine kinase